MMRLNERVYVVAEIGPNFVVGPSRSTNLRTLERLVDAASDAGADCVKVQLKGAGFYAGDDLTRLPHDPKRAPFRTRGEYVAQREPTRELLYDLNTMCEDRGIDWTASVWDAESVALLSEYRVPWVKVASASITDHALLSHVRGMGREVVLSTGGSDHHTIAQAVTVLGGDPVLAHCTMAYPCPLDALELGAIRDLADTHGRRVGFSSHSPEWWVPARAVHHGARWVEMHITTGTERWGPDHKSSLDCADFARAVREIRQAEGMIGSGLKRVLPVEEEAIKRLRRAK